MSRIDVQQGNGYPCRVKCFFRQVGNQDGILSTGKQQDRIFKLRSYFPQDVDGLSFEFFQVT